MSVTKSTSVAQASVANAAAGTTTGAWINLSAAYAASILVRITNGATGPTIGCTARVDLSPDNGATVYQGAGGSFTAGVLAAATYAAAFELAEDALYARVVFTGNTGQAVTVQADVTQITAL